MQDWIQVKDALRLIGQPRNYSLLTFLYKSGVLKARHVESKRKVFYSRAEVVAWMTKRNAV